MFFSSQSLFCIQRDKDANEKKKQKKKKQDKMEESPGREEQQCLRNISVYVSHYKETQKDGKKKNKQRK